MRISHPSSPITHVLLEADASEAVQRVDATPVDVAAAAGRREQGGHHVDPGLDRPGVARLERDVDAQARQSRHALGLLVGGLAAVADAEADHVADAVREEQRRRAALDERLGRAVQDAELDEALGHHQRGGAVDVVPRGSRPAGGDRGLTGAPDRVVDERLLGGERCRRRRTCA